MTLNRRKERLQDYDFSASSCTAGAGIARSVYRLATGRTVRGPNPSAGRKFCAPTWGPPSLL